MQSTQSVRYFDSKTGYGVSKARMERIVRHSQDVTGKTILDIGCGSGAVGRVLKTQGSCVVHGCDISSDALAEADQHLDMTFFYDVAEQKLADCTSDSYDVVIATELIEHLFQPHLLLSEIATVIKPDGVCIITTPNFLVWSNRVRMLFGQFAYTKTGLLDESHVHFFTYHTLHDLLKQEGYEVIKEDNVYHPKVPVWLAKKFPSLFVFQMVFVCKKVT